jgi:asparagine synthase (glutamine-hydrolysing)
LRTSSDTEVIVHLYEELGVDCLTKLRGMFAFALWDAKRQRLFCARDHLGQKPFYYALAGGELRFASEIKALTGTDPSLRTVDLSALDQYLTLRLIAPPKSMFQNVRKLPPAHYLTFGFDEGLRVERYWDLSYEPKHEGTDEALTDALEAEIVESLRLHLVSDVPVGAFMSGGLDSTLVVAMIASHKLAGRLQTFSMGLDHGAYNEAPAAKLVAERYGTDHREQMIHPTLVTFTRSSPARCGATRWRRSCGACPTGTGTRAQRTSFDGSTSSASTPAARATGGASRTSTSTRRIRRSSTGRP